MPQRVSIHFNAETDAAAPGADGLLLKPDALRPFLSLPPELASAEASDQARATAKRSTRSWSTETAARQYLQTLLENQGSERLAEVTSPQSPEAIPDLKLERSTEMALTGNQSVSFQQTSANLPVFGTRAVVDVNTMTRSLAAVDGVITHVPDISSIPKLSILEAIAHLAKHLNLAEADLTVSQAPTLCFYAKEDNEVPNADTRQEITWKLVYHFKSITHDAGAAADADGPFRNGCCGEPTPFGRVPRDYLVDANDGSIQLSYPVVAFLDIPIACSGTDVHGNPVQFDGLQVNAATFQLTDPLRFIETMDASFADIALSPNSASVVQHNSTQFPATAAAAVTAHSLSSQVFDFFNTVLKRNGVDDKGMKLISIVNCYYSRSNPMPSPGWRNAMWHQGRMWYGSTMDANSNPVSTSRFLDVMAHELAHGVTQTTAGLIYQNQSGALNESFSDIFGILIKNWYPGEPNPLSGWSWTLGDDWRGPGQVLRDCQDPTRAGQPAHMNNYVVTTQDEGGVHINSGIHNRAFYNVMTSQDAAGNPIFSPQEVAILYYVTLTRLANISNFSDCRRTLINVAKSRFQGQPTLQQAKLTAIRDAYDAVGIQ